MEMKKSLRLTPSLLVKKNLILYLRENMKRNKYSWFVVMSKKSRKKALRNLKNQNFEVFAHILKKKF